MNRHVILLIVTVLMLSLIGCNKQEIKDDKVAYIKANLNSEYEKVYKDLGLGILYDFDYKLPYADQSWVNIWVEGYLDGKKMEPFHLTELSYGLNPEPMVEGRMGFGLINPTSEDGSLFLYSGQVKAPPKRLNNQMQLHNNTMASSWDYAIGDEQIGLNSGETRLLGVYRKTNKKTISSYDYQDSQSVEKMIQDESVVLLLKIKVEIDKKSEGKLD